MFSLGTTIAPAKLAMARPGIVATTASTHKQVAAPIPLAPNGFNPLDASPAQLAEYGFPPRPSRGAGLSAWTDAMRHAKYEFLSPTLSASVSSGVVSPDGAVGQTQSPRWAGYYTTQGENSNSAFTAVIGEFVVPSVPANSYYGAYSTGDPMATFWAGLGGGESGVSNAGELAQAGVLAVSQASPSYYFFTETSALNQLVPVRLPLAVTAGDTVYIEVWYTSGEVHYYVNNLTTGGYTPVVHTDYTVTSDSAECIGEWPYSTSAYLPDYNHTSYSACDMATNYWSSFPGVSSYNYYQVAQWDSETRMQYPGGLAADGDSFELYWQNILP